MIEIKRLTPRLTKPGRTQVSGVPQGFDAMLLPEIAKAAGKRVTVHVAVDDGRALRCWPTSRLFRAEARGAAVPGLGLPAL